MQDDRAVAALLEFCRYWKPEIRVHWGDAFDFRAFRKNASQEESRDSIKADVERGLEFLTAFKPTVFLQGNHDARLWDAAICDDGKIADFASYLVVDIKEALGSACQVFPYDKRKGVFRLGSLKVIHGYNSGVTAARIAGQVYGSVIMGHLHTIDQYSLPGLERRVARIGGCLAKLDMQYNRSHVQTLRQAHGWVYGVSFPNGTYTCWQAEQINGNWFLPTEFKEIRPDAKGN
jgi:hypothetical protein